MIRDALLRLVISLVQLARKLLGVVPVPAPTPAPAPAPDPLPTPETAPHPINTIVAGADTRGHSHAWCGGTLEERRAMYALAEKVCKEEGLFPSTTRDLLATVWGESGWNQWCINTDTFDYGIAQFSRKYYLVEYDMTPQDALDDPEKCLRIMARNFKGGRASNWVAYSSGNYRHYIGKQI